MSLQISSVSPVNIGHQAIQPFQNYNPVPKDSSLDPITSQILKTQDAALEVMHLFENGTATRMWETQKKLPSATWLGNLVDWFLGWGKYHPESEKNEGVISERGQKRANIHCPNINETNGNIIRDYINTSYEMHNDPNNSCWQQDPKLYWTEFYQIIFKPVDSEDIICRIANCIRERLLACYPNCLPCQNATDLEREDLLNTSSSNYYFKSDFDPDLWWVYLIQTRNRDNYPRLNAWKLAQIHKLFDATRQDCENQVLHPPTNPALNALYSLLIIPVAVAGGIIFVVCKSKQANKAAYAPLESAVNHV